MLIVRETDNYYLTVRKTKDKTAVYFIVKSRVGLDGEVFGDNSAHVISCLKWEESLTPDEAKYAKSMI